MINAAEVQKVSTALQKSAPKVLQEGSSVNVRIISQKSDGSYIGTVAGAKVNIHSSKPLLLNQSFPATVSVKNGVIYVIPKDLTGMISLSDSAALKIIPSDSIAQKLNLPNDVLMSSIIEFSQGMELKLDSFLFSKIKNIAVRFKGKEISAAKLLLILVQKNISLSEEKIMELLDFLEGGFYDEDSDDDFCKDGINQINEKKGSWFIIPFKIVNLSDDEKVLAKGLSRFFYTSEQKLKMLNLECVSSEKKFLFSLLFEGSECKKIRFNCDDDEKEFVKKRLSKFSIPLEYVPSSELEGFNGYENNYFSFEGEV